MRKHKWFFFIVGITWLFVFITCSNQEKNNFSLQKLDLRQKIDESITKIDKQLEDLQKRAIEL